MPRKKAVDIAALADEVNDILSQLAADGYRDKTDRIKLLLHEQGRLAAESQKVNQRINAELSGRLRAIEQKMKRDGLTPYS